jgi:hypothetical protein
MQPVHTNVPIVTARREREETRFMGPSPCLFLGLNDVWDHTSEAQRRGGKGNKTYLLLGRTSYDMGAETTTDRWRRLHVLVQTADIIINF